MYSSKIRNKNASVAVTFNYYSEWVAMSVAVLQIINRSPTQAGELQATS
jgi:hypothetical protein